MAIVTKEMLSSRNYTDDCFSVLQGKKTREEIAAAYLQEVLDGKLFHLTKTCHWGREFVNLVKKCKVKPIYRNFSPNDEMRGEFSIHRTKAWDEVRVN